jgi:hypothetical protein
MVAIGADEKQKLYILLGLAGVLGLLVIFVIKPFGGGAPTDATLSTAPTATAPVSQNAVPPSTPGGAPGGTEGAPAAAPAPAVTAGMTPQLIAAEKFRPDPFTPYYTGVIAAPPLPPPPTPAPPVPIPPPPVPIPPPDEGTGGGVAPAPLIPGWNGGGGGDGTGGVSGRRLSGSNLRVNLPPVTIPQFAARTTPRVVTPGGRVGSAPTLTATTRSPNKRIAGIIIGNSVRAVIEINDGTTTTTRIVQPGDELEDLKMKILRIERITENNATVTRMTVLEDGQERYFDLRPSPNPIQSTLPGGGPGGGFPGVGSP